MTDVRLIVNGRAYSGWKSVTVTRSIESISGSFSLTVSDAAGDLPIREEDECRVEVDGQVMIDGYVERRSIRLDGSTRDVSFSGYDRAQSLVANSALLDRWTFRSTDVLAMARQLAAPFGVPVSLARGLELPKAPRKVVVNPGDSAFDAVIREASKVGVLLVSDGAGGLLLTRSGRGRAAPIVQGQNLRSAAVDFDASERFRRYVVLASRPGDEDSDSSSSRIRAEAEDRDVRRVERVQVLRPSTKMTTESARRHADWVARVRAAQADAVSVSVPGWKQPSGVLWPVNAIARMQAPAVEIDGDLLISEATFTIDNSGGEVTTMRLVRPDAFSPDPAASVRGQAEWKS